MSKRQTVAVSNDNEAAQEFAEPMGVREGFGVCPGACTVAVVEAALAHVGNADHRVLAAHALSIDRIAAAGEADGREAACDEQEDNNRSGACVAALTNPSGERIEPFRARSR